MTDKPKNIVGIRPDIKLEEPEEELLVVDEDVVEFLENVLEQAKRGLITEVAVVVMYYDHLSSLSGWQGYAYNPTLMTGEMYKLLSRYDAWSSVGEDEYE
jgi:hypothetical protein